MDAARSSSRRLSIDFPCFPFKLYRPLSRSPSRSQNLKCYAARRKNLIRSDGEEHLGSTLDPIRLRAFPGPTGKKGPPLRILPIGGLGEIGMNCMLVGVYDRFILVDAGLMFPDFAEVGMQKILPDTSFLAQWKEKIEAVIITHGHEDHIGAIPWVLPALDPQTPIFTSAFVHHLLMHRLKQFNLWDPQRFQTFAMNHPFRLGPFECEALRVTHSIPDCCGLIFRCSHGTILHTGDWKIDEDPIDGRIFDRTTFEKLSKENITLMMSDSTNVLTPGRSVSESVVREALMNKVTEYKGNGRIIATLFASNLHRLGSLKKAADAAGRKLCFVGLSLSSYLNAASHSGDAPFDPKDLIDSNYLEDIDPKDVMVVTTGSQAEPMSALNLISQNAATKLRLDPDDYIIYSAKIVPGNEKRVMKMMNRISRMGARILMDRTANLHASGHGYHDELAELIQLVKPQHFLPIHGESVFLQSHAELARSLGVQNTKVIHDGEMLGVKSLRNQKTVSSGSMQVLGDVDLIRYFNDGNKGTGTYEEMAIGQRSRLGTDGIIIVSADISRPPWVGTLIDAGTSHDIKGLRARIKITTRGIWTSKGQLIHDLFKIAQETISECAVDASCNTIDRALTIALRKAARKFNQIRPEVIAVVHEHDPRTGLALSTATTRSMKAKGIKAPQKTEKIETDRESGDDAFTIETSRSRSSPKTTQKRSEGTSRSPPSTNATTKDAIPTNDKTSEEDDPTKETEKSKTSRSSESTTKGKTSQSTSSSPSSQSSTKGKVPQSTTPNPSSQSTKAGNTTQRSSSVRRRGRPPKKESESTPNFEDLTIIQESILEKLRQRNPRERPVPGADLEYG